MSIDLKIPPKNHESRTHFAIRVLEGFVVAGLILVWFACLMFLVTFLLGGGL